MPSPQVKTQPNASSDIITIETTVTYKGEAKSTSVEISASTLAQKIKDIGPVKANEAIAALFQQVFAKTTENFKEVVNR